MISDLLKARFEKDEKRKKSMRLVYGYRAVETNEISDNLIILPYNQLPVNVDYLKHCISLLPKEKHGAVASFEIVRLGVWYKDRNKFDFLKAPEFCFNCGSVLKEKC